MANTREAGEVGVVEVVETTDLNQALPSCAIKTVDETNTNSQTNVTDRRNPITTLTKNLIKEEKKLI